MPLRKDRKKEEWIADKFMSLDNPTTTEKAIATFKGWPVAVRIAVPLVALFIVVGTVLFSVSKFDLWRTNRAIDRARQNVNAALADVNVAKQVVANDRVNEAVAVEQVKQAANDVLAASNASDAAKTETNKALANYAASVNANVQGTTANDLQRKLDALDR